MAAVDAAGGPTKETLASVAVPPPSAALMLETERLLVLSYLMGSDHLSTRLELADEPDAIPFEDAAAFLRARIPLTKDEWNSLEPKLRFRAFTTAAMSTPDGVDRVRRMALGAVEKGTSFTEFWTAAQAESAAGLGASPWYWETVYRTNVQTAYNAGRAAEVMRLNPPYLEFVGIEDSRQTSICQDRSGTILPSSHPFWQSNWPPLHFNCRSTVRAVFEEEVDASREGGTWDPDSGDSLPDSGPAKGFGGNPIETESFYKMTPGMVERAEAYGILDDIKALGKAVGLRYDSIALSTIANESGVSKIIKMVPGSKEERAALRKAAKDTLSALRDQTFVNKQLGESITLNKTGIDHAVSFAGDPTKLAILDNIPALIEGAGSFTVEKATHGNPTYIEVLRGKAAVEVNGTRNLFAVILKRREDGSLVFYDLMPWEQK